MDMGGAASSRGRGGVQRWGTQVWSEPEKKEVARMKGKGAEAESHPPPSSPKAQPVLPDTPAGFATNLHAEHFQHQNIHNEAPSQGSPGISAFGDGIPSPGKQWEILQQVGLLRSVGNVPAGLSTVNENY